MINKSIPYGRQNITEEEKDIIEKAVEIVFEALE